MTEADAYIQRLEESVPLRQQVLRAVVEALRLPRGSSGLDVGCGTGQQAVMLGEAVGPAGQVIGLDLAPEVLAYAGRRARQSGLAQHTSWTAGDMYRLPFADAAFDWVCSADCAGYPAGDLLPVLGEMARVTGPGGTVAILAWTSQQLLPGYPLLEARLNATCSAYAPYVQGVAPERQFLRAARWFRAAGLVDVRCQTFVGDVQAPLSGGVRQALASLFDMLWGQRQPGAADEDWAGFERLCRQQSPDCILDLPDYCAFFTYTMFRGRKG